MLAFVLSDPTYDKAHFDYNPGQSIVDKLTKLSKIGVPMDLICRTFLAQKSKFDFRVAGWVLAINFRHFRNCLIS